MVIPVIMRNVAAALSGLGLAIQAYLVIRRRIAKQYDEQIDKFKTMNNALGALRVAEFLEEPPHVLVTDGYDDPSPYIDWVEKERRWKEYEAAPVSRPEYN